MFFVLRLVEILYDYSSPEGLVKRFCRQTTNKSHILRAVLLHS